MSRASARAVRTVFASTLLAWSALAAPPVVVGRTAPYPTPPPIATMVGQKLIVRMDGTTPSAALTARIQRGEIGGVILFDFNVVNATQVRALTAQLQAIAAAAGRPPLIIAVDQEGGGIRRLTWAPPELNAFDMARSGVAYVRDAGRRTGVALAALGITLDLAPVVDVDPTHRGFMAVWGRTFSDAAPAVSASARAFLDGLQSTGVAATAKHFPGIGRVALTTDRVVGSVDASRADLEHDLAPFRDVISAGVRLVMLSNVTYAAYDGASAAGWSYPIATTLLRRELGFGGVSITDSLDGTAHSRGVTARALALRSAVAGVDLLLLTGSEKTSAAAFDLLCAEARAQHIALGTLWNSYDRILALKAGN